MPRRSMWREVPQARFLSWSDAMQRAYCAARDEDAALHAESDDWAAFYRKRAAHYRSSLSEAIARSLSSAQGEYGVPGVEE
jgi:hypothetical protein